MKGPRPVSMRPSLAIAATVIFCTLFVSCRSQPPPIQRFPGYPVGFQERGVASWYGPGFHGNKTANGERYDMHKLTAAHRFLPLGTWAKVINPANGLEVIVLINDRGPFVADRILDLSYQAAREINMLNSGVAEVTIKIIRLGRE